MAMKAAQAYWQVGGSGSIQIPDRLKLTCGRCGSEVGKDTHLSFWDDMGKLAVGCACDSCGSKAEVKIEEK